MYIKVPDVETPFKVGIKVVHTVSNLLLISRGDGVTEFVRYSSVGPSVGVTINGISDRFSFFLVSKEQLVLGFVISHVINVVVTISVWSEPILWRVRVSGILSIFNGSSILREGINSWGCKPNTNKA